MTDSAVCLLSPHLPDVERNELQLLLRDLNASELSLRVEEELNADITHVVCTQSDFSSYKYARAQGVNLVTPLWLRQTIKRKKMLPAKHYRADPLAYFSGFTITTAQIVSSQRDVLRSLIEHFGGKYQVHLDQFCTHLILLEPKGEKYKVASLHPLCRHMKIVSPDWINSCLTQKRRVSESLYTISPPLLELQPPPTWDESDELTTFINGVPVSDEHPAMEEDVPNREDRQNLPSLFHSLTFSIAKNMKQLTKRAVLADIVDLGGEVHEEYRTSDSHLVVEFQCGEEYERAVHQKQAIVTPLWVSECLLARDVLCAASYAVFMPPRHRDGIPDMRHLIVSISGYTKTSSPSRSLVKAMVHASGACLAGPLSTQHTHLILQSATGDKFIKAQEWNVQCVSHQWMEACLRHWKRLPETDYVYRAPPAKVELEVPTPQQHSSAFTPVHSNSPRHSKAGTSSPRHLKTGGSGSPRHAKSSNNSPRGSGPFLSPRTEPLTPVSPPSTMHLDYTPPPPSPSGLCSTPSLFKPPLISSRSGSGSSLLGGETGIGSGKRSAFQAVERRSLSLANLHLAMSFVNSSPLQSPKQFLSPFGETVIVNSKRHRDDDNVPTRREQHDMPMKKATHRKDLMEVETLNAVALEAIKLSDSGDNHVMSPPQSTVELCNSLISSTSTTPRSSSLSRTPRPAAISTVRLKYGSPLTPRDSLLNDVPADLVSCQSDSQTVR
eukprot:GILJ01007498.1.p1 GENE.GILJ01007498.1~~GILJ01007498.1.p1  ORF type:complete len:722 (-),score=89.31 GILJ01007498.1:318-2483(-)